METSKKSKSGGPKEINLVEEVDRQAFPRVKIIDFVSLGNIKGIEELIINNYDVNKKGEFGETAAYVAANRNDLKILKVLAEAGADLSLADKFGRTPLNWAKKYKNEGTITLITDSLAKQEAKEGNDSFRP